MAWIWVLAVCWVPCRLIGGFRFQRQCIGINEKQICHEHDWFQLTRKRRQRCVPGNGLCGLTIRKTVIRATLNLAVFLVCTRYVGAPQPSLYVHSSTHSFISKIGDMCKRTACMIRMNRAAGGKLVGERSWTNNSFWRANLSGLRLDLVEMFDLCWRNYFQVSVWCYFFCQETELFACRMMNGATSPVWTGVYLTALQWSKDNPFTTSPSICQLIQLHNSQIFTFLKWKMRGAKFPFGSWIMAPSLGTWWQ